MKVNVGKIQSLVQAFVLVTIIGTAAIMATAYLGSLVFVMVAALTNPHVNLDDKSVVIFDKAMQALAGAGMACLSFLFGYLARGPQRSPEEPIPVAPVNTPENESHPPKVENVSPQPQTPATPFV
jgi:hypothetical protein